ncbi:hypothetical protein LINPERPRIM_LOCUS42937 [Linum perenne]
MKSVRTFLLFYFAALLVMFLLSSTDAQTQRPPLCNSQFSLANYACSNLPFMELPHSALAPPSPPSDTPPDSPDGEHRHRHRHGQGHGHHHQLSSDAEENCCMWLNRLDPECVCDVLVRLPPFLAKPSHKLTVYVNDACVVTFSCSGRIVP